MDEKVIVEIKATRGLPFESEAQLLNYLKATDVEVGILLNFGPVPEIKRKVFDNFRKYKNKSDPKDCQQNHGDIAVHSKRSPSGDLAFANRFY